MYNEVDPLVTSYSHLHDFPRAADALLLLRRVSSLVKPIMRARGWRVGQLAEFYPDQANLLVEAGIPGLNENHGQRILIRLRFPGDRTLFMPIEQVVDTMLHELAHIVHGPHDAKFLALWNQLRDEQDGLLRKGYTGEGFLTPGRRLGGQQMPIQEARRQARATAARSRAEQDAAAGTSWGRRLGGTPLQPGSDLRRLAALAAERRGKRRPRATETATLGGCGNTLHNEGEIRQISDAATRNGFRTQAEEDAANEAAIAQALWELVQEDEQARLGPAYVPSTADNPTGSGGAAGLLDWSGDESEERVPESAASSAPTGRGWTCSVCTLHNPPAYLCCSACETERAAAKAPVATSAPESHKTRSRPRQAHVPEQPRSKADRPVQAHPSPPSVWFCECGKLMDHQWWSCSLCGRIKQSS